MHQFKLKGFNIVIDTGSYNMHVVDDLTYDIIEKLDKGISNEEILNVYGKEGEEVLSEIKKLREEELLFSKDQFLSSFLNTEKKKGEIKAMCLHVAHTCNLTCEYCFASQGKYSDNKENLLMPIEVSKKAIDFLIENSANRINLEVDFFGGEPLMNFDVVKRTVSYARSIEKEKGKNFRFTLTTNGVLVDEDVISFANKEMDNVVLSLDGRKKIHDKNRRTSDDKGSYDIVVPKFQNFVKKRGDKNYYIRGTYTKENMDFLEDIKEMLKLGFKELSMEPVVCDPKEKYALREEDLPRLYKEYEKLADLMMKKKKENDDFSFYHFTIDLKEGPCIHKRIAGCGSGTEYFAVTPNGDLYPCHQFVSSKEFKMGNIFTGIKREDLVDKFAKLNIYSRSECRDCWARLFCSGGCVANAYNAHGSIDAVDEFSCKLFKKRMECAIMMEIANNID